MPVWIGVDGDQIVFLTDPTSRNARNLERDPRVAISITDNDQPFTMAAVRGRVTERLEGDAAFAIIDRISHKYTGQPYPLRTDRVLDPVREVAVHGAPAASRRSPDLVHGGVVRWAGPLYARAGLRASDQSTPPPEDHR